MTFPRRFLLPVMVAFVATLWIGAVALGFGLHSAASPAAAEGNRTSITVYEHELHLDGTERVRIDGVDIDYDDGPELHGDDVDGSPGDTVHALSVAFFTDCKAGEVSSSCGGPPARWVAPNIPVAFCTFQANRPAHISAELFRDSVRQAAWMWTAVQAAVGVRYTGDCTSGTRWEHGNGRNEIGFDDERNAVMGSAAAVARGTWINIPGGGFIQERRFTEFDIVLHRSLSVPEQCFRSVVAHEMGHALGFGHSDEVLDLMFASFNPNNLATCPAQATTAEHQRLAELYGVNRAPVLTVQAQQNVAPGAVVTLTANAFDADGDPVTYEWAQLSGTAVALAPLGATASFTAPTHAGAVLVFEVTARDTFLKSDTARITVTVDSADAAPAAAPSLESFLPQGASSSLTWKTVGGAASYRFCSGTSCSQLQDPQAGITWAIVLGVPGSAQDRRVFTSGTRPTSMSACNSAGCSPAGAGPLAGGLRWAAWGMNYDFIAMAYDAGSVRFTIGGVANLSGQSRRFVIYSGTEQDPLQTVVHNCGRVPAGSSCIGLLQPAQRGHGTHITVVSDLAGTPTTEHRIKIR